MRTIKFIYFDFGGVFFTWDKFFTNAAREFSTDRQPIRNLFNTYKTEITKGLITPEVFWELCIKEFALKNDNEFNFLENWVDDFAPIKQTHALVHELGTRYNIGVISNIYKGMTPIMIQKGKVPDAVFTTKILSCDVNLQKPEKEIYELAQSESNYTKKEILYIDDMQECLDPAKEFGWQTFLFDVNNPDRSIAEIKEMLSLV